MSDRVLQHVLADLRPLWEHLLSYGALCLFYHSRIVPKLQAEVDVGSGGLANTKTGTVDVKRGGKCSLRIFFIRVIDRFRRMQTSTSLPISFVRQNLTLC